MLKQIKFRNFKNFRDEIVFSLDTPNNYEFNRQLIKHNIINDALIVGKNASGKTNLGFAIMDIVWHLTDKERKNVRPYSNLYSEEEVVCFEYIFSFEGKDLVYKYEKKQPDIPYREELYIHGKMIIENDGEHKKVDLKGAETLNFQLYDDTEMSLVKYVYKNTILDDTEINSVIFKEFFQFVSGMLWFSSTEGNRYIGLLNGKGDVFEKILEKDGTTQKLEEFLEALGISYTLLEKDAGEGTKVYCRMGKREVPLATVCSSGTKALIFFYFWYLQNEKVSFVYMDEFDAFYHTDLARKIVETMIELSDVQTILTTHNTDLISNEILRPDCIFELKNNKIVPFSDLTYKALREAHNLQKMYKAGAFDEE